MLHTLSLAAVLFAVWYLLSGHDSALILILGAFSALFVAAIARRMALVDREGHPLHLGWSAPGYWLWLAWQIVVANLDVARRILDPRLPIDPSVIRRRAGQRTELGKVIYANSITLTPGTVTIDVEGDEIVVHALSGAAARALETGKMDRRVSRLEGCR